MIRDIFPNILKKFM